MKTTGVIESIRVRRKLLGVDQRNLARIAGISVHALSDLESGKGNPTLQTLEKVMDVLGLELQTNLKELPSGADDA